MNDEDDLAVYEDFEHWLQCGVCEEGFEVEYDARGNVVTCPNGHQSYVGMHDDLPEAIDNDIRYRWRCPACDIVNYEEGDPRGDTLTCECGVTSTVR